MKIGILTQYFPPEIGAPQNRLSSLAKRLVGRGHEVIVLTATPNYPLGRIYPGFKNGFHREKCDGIAILRVPIFPSKSLNRVLRLCHYFSFVLSSLIAGIVCLPNVDYLLTESPPLFLGMSGYILSRIKSAKWIFNVSDLWPESAVSLGIIRGESWGFILASALERFCYHKASLITCQSQSIQKNIHQRFPYLNTYHLSNGVETERFEKKKSPALSNGNCKAVYVGLHGLAQGLGQILRAMKQLNQLPLTIDFVGDGPEKEKLKQYTQEYGLSSVRFLEPVPMDSVPKILATADIVIVPLRNHIVGAVPSKLYEAMAAGSAVLLIAEGEAADIVSRHECGVIVKPGDENGLVNALKRLYSDPALRLRYGKAGRAAAEQFFDRPRIEAAFINYLEQETK